MSRVRGAIRSRALHRGVSGRRRRARRSSAGSPRNGPAEAAETILAENLLGGTCARVCPVEMLCEGACVLDARGPAADRDRRASALRDRLGFRASQPLRVASDSERPPRRRDRRRARPGSRAPANWPRAATPSTVYDEREEVGGLVRYAIAPYRQQRHPLPAEARPASARRRVPARDERSTRPRRSARSRRTSTPSSSPWAWATTSTCAIPGTNCPASGSRWRSSRPSRRGERPSVGRRVVVIGGGNTAVDVARESVRLGADDVTVVYRRTRAEMPAYPRDRGSREEGVTLPVARLPVRFVGSRDSRASCAS